MELRTIFKSPSAKANGSKAGGYVKIKLVSSSFLQNV